MPIFDQTRKDWGARSPKKPSIVVSASKRTEFFNHYDGGHPLGLAAKPHSACLAQVKADQAFHMDGNGWSDIGYNGLVCQHGKAIEGRGIDAIGAHCPNHNTTGYGFQFMVGGNESPTPAAFARMAKLHADCTARSGHALAKKGHRDGWATACPGDIVEAWVKGGMKTTTAAPNQSQEDDMPTVKEVVDGLMHANVPRPDNTPVSVEDTLTAVLMNTYRTQKLVAAALSPATLSAAVAAGIKAAGLDADVDVDALAKAIVVELGKD